MITLTNHKAGRGKVRLNKIRLNKNNHSHTKITDLQKELGRKVDHTDGTVEELKETIAGMQREMIGMKRTLARVYR